MQLYFNLASYIDSAKESVNKNLLNGSKSRTQRTRLQLFKWLVLTNLTLLLVPLNLAAVIFIWTYALAHSQICILALDILVFRPVPKILKIAYESTCFTFHMCLPWFLGKKTANQVMSALVNSRFQDTWFLKLFHKLGMFLCPEEASSSENDGYESCDSIDKDCDIDIGSDYEKITDQITIEESFIEQASKTSRGLGEKLTPTSIPKKGNSVIKPRNYNGSAPVNQLARRLANATPNSHMKRNSRDSLFGQRFFNGEEEGSTVGRNTIDIQQTAKFENFAIESSTGGQN